MKPKLDVPHLLDSISTVDIVLLKAISLEVTDIVEKFTSLAPMNPEERRQLHARLKELTSENIAILQSYEIF